MMMVLASFVYPHLQPEVFRVGRFAVRWYGLAYLLGFILAYLALQRMIARGVLRLTVQQLGDLVSWLVLGVLLGGRLGWWLFYHRPVPDVVEPWYEPLAIWHGGMSFHGGLVGVVVALTLWSAKNRAPGFNIADCAALVAPVGLFFGRIANFINAELVGRPTTVSWGVIFPGDTVPRHPSQLYEAILEGPVLLAALWAVRQLAHPREGRVAALFLVFYGVIRFSVEFTRQPDVQLGFIAFGWLTMGQLLSLVLVLIGVGMFFAIKNEHRTLNGER